MMRNDMEAKGIDVRRRRLGHIIGEERSISGSEDGERSVWWEMREELELKVGSAHGVAEEVIATVSKDDLHCMVLLI